jgi:hypothetical protein
MDMPRKYLTTGGYGASHSTLRKQFEKYGEVNEGTTNAKPSDSAKPQSDKDELKQLRHEVDYMKQETIFQTQENITFKQVGNRHMPAL